MKTTIMKSVMAMLLPITVWAQTPVSSGTCNKYFGSIAMWEYHEATKTLTIRPGKGEESTQKSSDFLSNIVVNASNDAVNKLGSGGIWTYTKGVQPSFDVSSGDYVSSVPTYNEKGDQISTDVLHQSYRFVDFVPTSGNPAIGFNIPNTLADTYDIYLVTCPIWLIDDYNNIPQEEWDVRPYRFTTTIIERNKDGVFPKKGTTLNNPEPIDESQKSIFLSKGIIHDENGHIIVNDTTYLGQYKFKNEYNEGNEYDVIIQIASSILSSQRIYFSNEMLISSIILKPHNEEALWDTQKDVDHVVIENGITEINYVFGAHGFQNIKTVDIPNSVTSMGEGVFKGCSSLSSMVIPNSVTSIGATAFSGCDGLTSVTMGNGITEMGNWFAGNTSIKELKMGEFVTSIGEGAFSGCSGLTSTTIPEGVTSIGTSAFSGCSGLTSTTIPEGVTTIGASAFSGCSSLTALTIPNSVTSIGYNAFDCSGLTSIKVLWNRPLAISNVFGSVDRTNCKLYVPKGTATMFMSATEWSKFVNIVEYEDGEDAHYITIRMGDGGVLKQSVEVGQTYTYAVSADEGWEVNTLTFDGKDMTALLLDGQFSTPVITGNAELNVVFKQIDTYVKTMPSVSEVKVYASNKNITVTGAEENAPVSVYGINGALVTSAVGNATFTLESGVYVVKVGEETFKVRL